MKDTLVPYFASLKRLNLLLEKIAHQENHVRRAFGEAAHKIWIPMGAIRNINAHRVSFRHKLALQIGTNAIEHLKFKALAVNFVLRRVCFRPLDNFFVVRRQFEIRAARCHSLGKIFARV